MTISNVQNAADTQAVTPTTAPEAGSSPRPLMADEAMTPRGKWPPFPWNPADLDNPLIGRDEALSELARAFEDVVSDWMVRIQLVVSDYGLGKSRLMSAFIAAALEREPSTSCIEVRCPNAGGGGGPYRLWDAVVRKAFDVPAEADAIEAGALVRRGVERYLPSDLATLVSQVVGAPSTEQDDDASMARCIGAIGRLFEALAFEKPLLIVVDDANRASARDFALASAFASTVKGRPIMVVLAGSPNLADHLPGWERFPLTRLRTLHRHEADRMLRLFLTGLSQSPSRELIERILSTAAGNSYAIKAMVRWLHESGGIHSETGPYGERWYLDEAKVGQLVVPDNLEGVIHARIHALSPTEREVLAQSAVIGREFWIGALVAIARSADTAPTSGIRTTRHPRPQNQLGFLLSDDTVGDNVRSILKKLVAARFIETRPSRFRGEECFGFRSTVHWEAAIEAIPQTTLMRWHRVALSWLELMVEGLDLDGGTPGTTTADPVTHQPTRTTAIRGPYLRELAHHAEGAGNPGLAATYSLKAARHALLEGHSRVALTALETALRLVQPDQASTRLKILHDLGEVNALAGATDLAVDYFKEALELAWRLGDRRIMAIALRRLAEVEGVRGNFPAARAQLMDALKLAEQIQDPHGVAAACIALGRLHWMLSEFDQALRCYKKAEHLYRRLSDETGIGEVLHSQGAVHYDRGDVGLAEKFYDEALAIRRRVDDKRGLVKTLNNLGAVWMSRRLERAVTVWKEALIIAQELADLGLQATLADNLGEALSLLRRHDEALVMLERSIELAELTGRKNTLVDALRNLGIVRTARGEWDLAKDALLRAQGEAERLGLSRLQALVSRAFGDLAMARMESTGVIADGDTPLTIVAEQSYLAAASRLEEAGYDLEAAVSYEKLADALTLAGRREEAKTRVDHARSLRAEHLRPPEPPPLPS